MKNYFAIAIKLTFATVILFGIGYPFLVTGLARIIAPNGGRGAEVIVNGRPVGFELIGQKFDESRYFNSRPSAVDYNPASTGGSNKAPTNQEYLSQVQARIDTFLVHNPGVNKNRIPVDLVTASGGGLDPHISVHAARVQMERIANARRVGIDQLEKLVQEHVEEPFLGMGPSRVHVLRLNIALDELK